MPKIITQQEAEERFKNSQLKLLDNYTNSCTFVRVLCRCGSIFCTKSEYVFSGDTTSCGCQRIKKCKNRFQDLKDYKQKLGKLTVINYSHAGKHGERIWNCICTCGQYTKLKSSRITKEIVKSCGKCNLMRNGIFTSYIALKLHDQLIQYGYKTTYKHHNFKTQLGYYIDIAIRYKGYKIGIEYDSKYYHSNTKKDKIRIKNLLKHNWKILIIRSNKKLPKVSTVKNRIEKLTTGSYKEIITLKDWYK